MSAPEGRVGRVLAAMEREGAGTLLLTPSSSLKYVLGGGPIVDERLFVLALSPGREPFLLANSLYELEAGELFAGEKLFWRDGEDPYPLLARELARRGYPTVCVAVDKSTPGALPPAADGEPTGRGIYRRGADNRRAARI